MQKLFKSRYTDKNITAAQYLAELMCERLAKREKTDLPLRFWNLTKWKRTFLYQVQLANSLLKLYEAEVIIKVLRNNPNVYSLNAKFLDAHLASEQEKFTRTQQTMVKAVIEDVTEADTAQKPRVTLQNKKSILSKLRELDG